VECGIITGERDNRRLGCADWVKRDGAVFVGYGFKLERGEWGGII
jgi:hypothetical protein